MKTKKNVSQNTIFPAALCAFVLLCLLSPDAEAGEAALLRGNYWVKGIAGFGANSIPALAGEYRFRSAGEGQSGRQADFAVFATREPLFFSREWQPVEGTGAVQALQRTGEEGFLAAVVVNIQESRWNAVFRFERGLEGAGLSGEDFNRLLQAWVNSFSFSLSHSTGIEDASLPAILEF